MRAPVDAARLESFMDSLARELRTPCAVYFTGGATAVLHGWRDATLDIDVKFVPDGEALRVIPKLKDMLSVNVELAAPTDFIPELPGSSERHLFVRQMGMVTYHHFDLYAQALAKVERGLERDVVDVRAMLDRGLITAPKAWELFTAIEPALVRFPAIDPMTFRWSMQAAFGTAPGMRPA